MLPFPGHQLCHGNEEEQISIFERYCRFLNSLDVNFKITVNNKNKDMEELRSKVFLQS